MKTYRISIIYLWFGNQLAVLEVTDQISYSTSFSPTIKILLQDRKKNKTFVFILPKDCTKQLHKGIFFAKQVAIQSAF